MLTGREEYEYIPHQEIVRMAGSHFLVNGRVRVQSKEGFFELQPGEIITYCGDGIYTDANDISFSMDQRQVSRALLERSYDATFIIDELR
ncbi:hypothetical protein LRY65_05090 [Candidatus Woesebacteria bacterium]|nr:hypothetical protein [Candidatus Woesebacteria bacterium]MCD8506837.1 hypothetical protein [Candidatus Woesebacteria bacterium]MCD8527544.1 hypothetical protein [Candidatus Woesebacteria bacterium]MCD8546284.1 hypothetical protein [Candidatus Woesebacteria bacterium]